MLQGLEQLTRRARYFYFRGSLGSQRPFLGYWVDDGRFKLEISEKRGQWLIRGIETMEGSGWLVDVKRFHELHGRLGFMSQVLVCAWPAAVRKAAVLPLPNLVRCVLRFIADRLRLAARTYDSGRIDKDCCELFRIRHFQSSHQKLELIPSFIPATIHIEVLWVFLPLLPTFNMFYPLTPPGNQTMNPRRCRSHGKYSPLLNLAGP